MPPVVLTAPVTWAVSSPFHSRTQAQAGRRSWVGSSASVLLESTPAHAGLGLVSCSCSAGDLGVVLQQDEVKGVRPGF